jgi:serine phosphatase RsbU (regulator of sigma subunit)
MINRIPSAFSMKKLSFRMLSRVYLVLTLVFLVLGQTSGQAIQGPCNSDSCIVASLNDSCRRLVDSNHALALKYADSAIRISERMRNPELLAYSINSLATALRKTGEFSMAIDQYLRALRIAEAANDPMGIAYCNAQIGIIHQMKGDPAKALPYYKLAETRVIHAPDPWAKGKLFEAIAACYDELLNADSAVYYYELSQKYFYQSGDPAAIAQLKGNMASMYLRKKDFPKAMELAIESMRLADSTQNFLAIAQSLIVQADILSAQNKNSSAEPLLQQALSIMLTAPGKDLRMEVHQRLAEVYQEKRSFDKALDHYRRSVQLKDSISSERLQNEITRKELVYGFSKEKLRDSIHFESEKQQRDLVISGQNEKLARERTQKFFLAFGVLAFVIISLLIYRSYRNKKRDAEIIAAQKEKVEHQKEMLEEKNREILDSITYAKRIQSAILPPTRIVKAYLPDSFVLYKPKDIVAGDFYWFEHAEGRILFSASDCTGHGVPGAMVSVVCNNALNRSVREYGLTEPGRILDKAREIVVSEFEKSEEEVKDGMDVSLCALNLNTKTMHWAGANNPLWLIRNGELIEYKPDKQPIGKYENPKPFSTHEIECINGDVFYIFTDGYEDQFGGEKGKKFKAAAMKKLFLSVSHLSMDEQRIRIDEAFESWKGDLEQVDDVCVIGLRIVV